MMKTFFEEAAVRPFFFAYFFLAETYMKYDVHIYTLVRVLVPGIEADDKTSAIEKAEERIDFHSLFRGRNPETDWAEEIMEYVVDERSDGELIHSEYLTSEQFQILKVT